MTTTDDRPVRVGDTEVHPMRVTDAYVFTPTAYPDDRGSFHAPYQAAVVAAAVGHPLTLAQVNQSVSRRGTIRGVHFADTPPGQAKFVFCSRGSVLDVVVDLRVGSPSFGTHDAVELTAGNRRALYVAEGLGHAFLSLADGTVLTYLCSTGYDPAHEHGVDPLDPALGLPWPQVAPLLSAKDAAAPTLDEALRSGLLPRMADCRRRYEALREA
ncbi:dTDP-4-dehydrorhamnose 3,5-epimerase family protein [Actinocatenispora rupis]|uniref:dTDP-4-dehydrorhamnose 3,5-epimerase n=1 Tax=Actinocatenispora rupis TaxID=519421 RepID=A0A8J3JCB7_9ACTN|nr:dTDP-4-dehydrorhamnose 3,5-epimerase family protein [Actinocatenispora rupis]GID12213.1 dTDP-4-dehydrorhamnose 3,5-epimerase [Actinocatenispora rupis]